MVRKNLKKISKSDKLKAFIKKYKVPSEYLSTNRRMVSRAVLIGLFIAFIPMPMQMALVLAMMIFVKFNVPIGLAMCWISNPFTMPPMYYMNGLVLILTIFLSTYMLVHYFMLSLSHLVHIG